MRSGWNEAEPKQARKLRQKDLDARWTKKNNETHYGYKNHAKVDRDSKMIVDYKVTSANVHDSRPFADLIDETDQDIWADSAYVGEELEASIKAKNPKIKLHIIEKGYKNKPLTDEQKASNREKSRIRCRVEHVFEVMTQSMEAMMVRTIGKARAEREIAMKNLAYNLKRYVFLSTAKNQKCG